nr:Fe-S cluster assembly protein SufD [Saccharibacter sp. 17.LH.SD]
MRKEGLHIRVPAGVHAGLLTLVSFSEGKDVSIHLRHRIVLEEGASLTLLDVQGGYGHYLSNPQIEVVCAKGAHLRHVKHQRESKEAAHLGIVAADVAERGNYNSFTLNQGSVLARHEVVTTLQEKHAHTNVNGVQLLDGARLNDLTSMIHHAAPECTSRQTVRTVLSDSAQGVFQGKILVDQIAQKTDGYQMNQALLLSEKAQMNSKPELEIYADDVKCSHGATVGALDEEQLFYLQSRGVPGDQARDILVRAFLREAFEMLDDEELQNYLLRNVPGHD